jgi:hypothetical protein
VFKVKGANTSGSVYTYDELTQIMLQSDVISMKDQIQFAQIIKDNKFEGITVNKDLTKTFKTMSDSKRV